MKDHLQPSLPPPPQPPLQQYQNQPENHQHQLKEEHPAQQHQAEWIKGPIRSVSASSVGGHCRFRFDDEEELNEQQDYGSRLLSSEGADMDSADRSFLEFGLATAVSQTVRVATANTSTMTNSDSCQDWTGAVRVCNNNFNNCLSLLVLIPLFL